MCRAWARRIAAAAICDRLPREVAAHAGTLRSADNGATHETPRAATAARLGYIFFWRAGPAGRRGGGAVGVGSVARARSPRAGRRGDSPRGGDGAVEARVPARHQVPRRRAGLARRPLGGGAAVCQCACAPFARTVRLAENIPGVACLERNEVLVAENKLMGVES